MSKHFCFCGFTLQCVVHRHRLATIPRGGAEAARDSHRERVPRLPEGKEGAHREDYKEAASVRFCVRHGLENGVFLVRRVVLVSSGLFCCHKKTRVRLVEVLIASFIT